MNALDQATNRLVFVALTWRKSMLQKLKLWRPWSPYYWSRSKHQWHTTFSGEFDLSDTRLFCLKTKDRMSLVSFVLNFTIHRPSHNKNLVHCNLRWYNTHMLNGCRVLYQSLNLWDKHFCFNLWSKSLIGK